MNIIVKPYGRQLCYCRPDTTWERENKDYYVPECVNVIYWTPILFARVSKAGKCIKDKFVSRYYDAVGYGILLYCNDDETAYSSCLDHTSILPMPLYNPVVLESEDNSFVFSMNNADEFKVSGKAALVEDAICLASGRTSLRIGDMVAVELEDRRMLGRREAGDLRIKGVFCENELFDLKVIF